MKKFIIVAFAVASLATAFTSCKKDVSEEELLKNQLAQADSLLKRGGVIKYTVKVVSTANSSMLKSKMSIENASVTVYQNDKVFTGQTDAMGFITFSDMRVGTVAVNVTLKDHAEVDYVADITPQEQLTNLSQSQVVNTIRYASTMVPMFPTVLPGAASITGRVTAELDLTNTIPEPAQGVKVTAIVDVDDPDFVSRYIAPTLSNSTPSAGRILKYSFAPDNDQLTTTTDINGDYSLTVPSSINGLPIKLSVNDYTYDKQKIYLENDPKTGAFAPNTYQVKVLFSKNSQASITPKVLPAYVIIDEPTCPIGYTIKPAVLKFNTDPKTTGIRDVTVTDGGNYSSKPFVKIWNNNNQVNAILDVQWNSTSGAIEKVNVTTSGSGYNSTSYINSILLNTTRKAVIEPIVDNGQISLINIIDKGYGYITVPKIDIITPYTVKTKAEIYIYEASWQYELRPFLLTNKGEGYKSITNYPTYTINPDKESTIYITNGQTQVKNIYLGTGTR